MTDLTTITRPVLPYAASLTSFHCFCQREHVASPTTITCACGRYWHRLPVSERREGTNG